MRESGALWLLLGSLILRRVGRRPRLLLPAGGMRAKLSPRLATPPPPRLLVVVVDRRHVYRGVRRVAVAVSASAAIGMVGQRLVGRGGVMVRRVDGVGVVLARRHVVAIADDPAAHAMAAAGRARGERVGACVRRVSVAARP